MKVYTTQEWAGVFTGGIVFVEDEGKITVRKWQLDRDEAIKLADDIYEKLGLGKRGVSGVYYSTLVDHNKALERERDDARGQLDNYVALYERANHKVHEKDEEITALISREVARTGEMASLVAKLSKSEKENAGMSARIFELRQAFEKERDARCSIPANAGRDAEKWQKLTALLRPDVR